jgi:2-polyprenyl-3-methyl-5-hydroxy-6-metoxy-1,4-benzoquinol methylase
MKVYLGNRSIKDESFKVLSQVEMLEYVADDSECTSIILDGLLRQYSINKIPNILSLIVKKLRPEGSLIISDIDFDLLVFAYRKTGNLLELNQMAEQVKGFKSFITNELVKDFLNQFQYIQLKSVVLSNIEFKLEYTKVL